jgi:hypothetical protein
MAAILKTDLYCKLERLEHWKLSLRCANANSISRRRKQKTENRKQKTENRKQIIRDLRHLTFQVSVIKYTRVIGKAMSMRTANQRSRDWASCMHTRFGWIRESQHAYRITALFSHLCKG